jgi:hypothetical protein
MRTRHNDASFNCVRHVNPRECRDAKPHFPVIPVPFHWNRETGSGTFRMLLLIEALHLSHHAKETRIKTTPCSPATQQGEIR